MYPHERSLVKQLAGKPFEIVGVNSDRDIEKLKDILVKKNITWRSFQNQGGDTPISSQWNVRGWPTTYVLDSKGVIRYKNVRGAQLDNAIVKLLKEMDVEVELEDHAKHGALPKKEKDGE